MYLHMRESINAGIVNRRGKGKIKSGGFCLFALLFKQNKKKQKVSTYFTVFLRNGN